MKKTLAILLFTVLLLGLFAACGDRPEETASSSETVSSDGVISKEKVEFLTADSESVYRIVRPDGEDELETTSLYLYKQLKDILNTNVKNMTDAEDGMDIYEILIGNCDRAETAQAKAYLDANVGGRYKDYIICTIGKKIVIYSADRDSLMEACKYFVENYVKAGSVDGGILYTFAATGDFETVTLSGVDIGRYDFIRPHYNSSYLTEVEMQKLSQTVYEKTGYMPEIKHDAYTEPSDYEIIVGNADREGVEEITNYDTYKITVKDTVVYINGGSAHATAMGVSEFSKMLMAGTVTETTAVEGSYEAAFADYDRSAAYYKTWGDDFDGTALDTSKWHQRDETDHGPGLNGKTSVRSSDPRDVFVTDGSFYICAREDEQYYYGGMIRTDNTMTFKYGYVEMSAVIPQGNGFWVALWACSNDSTATFDENEPKIMSPEIDIVECFGNSSYYGVNCHSWPTPYGSSNYGFEHTSLDRDPYSAKKKYVSIDEGVVLGDDFHTYGLLWDSTQMSFTCDGDLFMTYDTTTSFEDQECFNHSMYLIISLACGFESNPPITEDPAEWSETNKFIVDWVNIYQKDDGASELNRMGAN